MHVASSAMRKILSFLKRIWILNFFRRIYLASTYFNKKYCQILKWGLRSREDTNFTYHLTEDNLKYLAHTVSLVTKTDYEQVMQFLNEAQSDVQLQESILAAMEKSPGRRFADREVRFGRRLGWYAFARALKPKVIIETGVDKGLGAVLLCAALLRNREEGREGRYYGTDINPGAGYFLDGKYAEVGEILYGDSIGSLREFNSKIDLFINDSDHSADYEYEEYQTIRELLSDASLILGDNAHCTGKLADFSRETGRKFIYFQEAPLNHWYPGAGIGISFKE